MYRHGKDRQAIVESVQEELNRLGNLCTEFKGRIHPDKACGFWCSLNNKAVKTTMPPVFIKGKELQREDTLKYVDVTFYCSLCGNEHISKTIVKTRKGLVALKTKAGARMTQRILCILFQALIFSTLSEAQLERLKVIQNEAMRAILGCTRDTSAETMRYLLGFLTMAFLDSQM